MPQVIIVSNRLPFSVKKEDGILSFSPSVGGLATGLSSYANNKDSLWIGWPGIASDELTSEDKDAIIKELAEHNCSPVFLSKKQIDYFYNGYSNTVLWPLFHQMRPQDKPGVQRDTWYRAYRAVNRLFAETIEVTAQNGARVWVHDYQLMLVPSMLQDLNVNATIGYFHHIPIPEPKKFLSLQNHKAIIKGILGADLIGFHTPGYVENFLKTCEQAGLGTAGDGSLMYDGRTIKVSDFPMGIDYEKYASAGDAKAVKQVVKDLRRQYKGKKVIVAVDRLDPSKGLLERVKAYGMLLEAYPKLRGKVSFVMVAAPSRTDVPAYQRLAKRLDALVAEVNQAYGTAKWQPIDYINRTVPFEGVTAYFQIADVAFIAPLRDGMNLAAKEFVASSHKDSVLILSETAGASQELHDALIVNPRKPETVVEALHKALTMRRWELRRRLRRMKRHLKTNTVHKWAKDFVGALQKPIQGTLPLTRPLGKVAKKHLFEAFSGSRKRLLLLDYDGTLVPFASDHRQAKPAKELIEILKNLAHNPANDVVVISGRSAADLETWFGKIPVRLVAEHGAAIKQPHGEWLVHKQKDEIWKKLLLPALEKYAAKAPGARVEEKAHSVVWHYRDAAPYYAQKYGVTIRQALRPFLKEYGLQILKGNKVLEIKDPRNSKGKAVELLLDQRHEFVLAIGDDMTDEDMFEAVPQAAYSVKVGRGNTAARYRLASYKEVRRLLQDLAGLQ